MMHATLNRLFGTLDSERLAFCVLRDAERIDQLASGEVDLLVAPDQWDRFRAALARAGFVPLLARGYAPHHFYVAYDARTDTWLKIDAVSELIYGRPIKTLPTGLAADVLAARVRVGEAWGLAPQHEVITLLLHAALDKGRFDPARAERLQQLAAQIEDPALIDDLLATYWTPGARWEEVRAQIEAGEWSALLAQAPAVAARLRQRDPLGVRTRAASNRLLRRLDRSLRVVRPAIPSVAVLGPDGAGKSTVADGIQDASLFPVRRVYMGLYQKRQKRAARALPGLGFARLLLTQWGRYLTARSHQAAGRLVIFDRYAYDALLPSPRPQSLPRRIRRWLLAHTCPPPDLVVLLDAPAEILFARKGEHGVEALESQRQSYLALRQRIPQMVVVDATEGIEATRRRVSSLIWQAYVQRSGGQHA
ncbi:MAG: hypothetical protein IT325_11475 [Anaerolineae bacterium]|nr:hypothetical protein [Anaerolineae bacterium]